MSNRGNIPDQIIRLKCFNCEGNYMVPKILPNNGPLTPNKHRKEDRSMEYECVRCKNITSF